jgi:hypothetical protein
MTSDVTEQQPEPHVQFAAAVVSAAYEQGLSPTTVFNGLNIAAAAMLVDYVASDEGSVDPVSLQVAINNFKTGLEKAAEYAVEQFKQYSQPDAPVL